MQKSPTNLRIRKGKHKHTITDIAPSAATSRMTIIKPVKQASPTRSDKPLKRKKKDEIKKIKERQDKSPMRTNIQDYPALEQLMDPIYFENRTVNSAADITENNEEIEELPKKKMKRRKIAPIDSEVELVITKEPAYLDLSQRSLSPKAKQQLGAIKTTMQKAEVFEEKLKKTGKEKKKISNTSSPENQLTASKEKSKLKRSLEAQTALEKYPILKDSELVKKFLSVSMTNNQKGRIRQVIKDVLHGTSTATLPDVINNRIQAILKGSVNLTDTDLRKIRILYNMLKKATEEQKLKEDESLEKKTKVVEEVKDGKVKVKNKEKKQKRYVVFVGNLPIHVTKEEILAHFSTLSECIKDVRIPPREEGKKSSIAYLELDNEPSFQLALSQHHSMMGSKRINVLYTTHKNSKMTKAQAKAKGAKLTAMGKKGQLVGSRPAHKKRSHRRNKMKQAQKDAENAEAARNLLRRHPVFATSH